MSFRKMIISEASATSNLSQQIHDLLRRMLLASSHTQLLLFQFVSSQLVQIGRAFQSLLGQK
jgi:hypothetical protein